MTDPNTFRDLAILDATEDTKVKSFVNEVRETQARLDTEQQQLFDEGNLSPQGVGENMARRREEERQRLEALSGFLAARSQNLEKKVEHSQPTPTFDSLDSDVRRQLLDHFTHAGDDERRRLLASLESKPDLCAAIASLNRENLYAYPGVSEFTHDRATAIACGGRRDDTGRIRFPNQKEHQKLQVARTNHVRALRIIKSL